MYLCICDSVYASDSMCMEVRRQLWAIGSLLVVVWLCSVHQTFRIGDIISRAISLKPDIFIQYIFIRVYFCGNIMMVLIEIYEDRKLSLHLHSGLTDLMYVICYPESKYFFSLMYYKALLNTSFSMSVFADTYQITN